jgi:choline kinase
MTPGRAIMLANAVPTAIVERHLDAFAHFGVHDVTLVARFEQPLRLQIRDRVRFVSNRFHGSANTVFSLWLARDVLRRGALIVNGGTSLSPETIGRVLDASVPDAVLGSLVPEDRIVELAKVGPEGGRWLVRHIEALIAGGASDAGASIAFHSLAKRWPMQLVHVLNVSPVQLRAAV